MSTIIDALIVELKLDPTNFTKGQKEAAASFLKTKQEAARFGKEIESSAANMSQAFSTLKGQALGLFALVAGGASIKGFIERVATSDATVGRYAKTLDTTTEALSAWRGLAVKTGGTVEGITSSIKGLVQQFQMFSLTGESSVIPYFRALGVNIADANGKMRPFNEIMFDLADAFSKLDPAKAAAFGTALGFDDATISLLLRGRAALEQMLETQMKIGNVTAANSKAASELQERWGNLILRVETFGRIAIPKIGRLADILNTDIRYFFKGLGLEGASFNQRFSPAEENPLGTAPPGTVQGGSSKRTSSGAFSSAAEKEAFIRSEAAKRGIDPDQAMRVARAEGFTNYVGDKGTSFGTYQLHYKNSIPGLSNPGLGDKFTKSTGLNARDPATEREQIKFALDEAARGGWGPWHGWRGAPFAGIGVPSGAGAAASTVDNSRGSTSSSQVTIGKVEVNTQATDAEGIARDIGPAIQRNSVATQSNNGPQ